MVFSKDVKETISMIVVGLMCTFMLTNFVIRFERVAGTSMVPTLKEGDIGFCWLLDFRDYDRFEIVSIDSHLANKKLIKRIIAFPGETVEVKDEELYINGNLIQQDFLNTEFINESLQTQGYFTENFGPITLQENEIFALGDNRPTSVDSRDLGPFKLDEVDCIGFNKIK